jgi:hypothetical protein
MRQACELPPDARGLPPEGGSYRIGIVILVVLLAGCGAGRAKPADDLTTTTEVKIALLSDPRLGGQRLEVSTHQGVVLLSGTVRTRADELQAIALAKKIRGVRDVRSELKVQE